ncbi:acyltransferase [Comamonadaceae bacterium PP-2]
MNSKKFKLSAIYIKLIRLTAVYFFGLFNRIFVTPGWKVGRTTIFRGPLIRYSSYGDVSIGKRCVIGAFVVISTDNNAIIEIGDDVSINMGSHVISNKFIKIGDRTRIGEYACIRDADHGMEPGANRLSMVAVETIIEEDVWIGAHVTILKGVRIGHGAIVGAGAVVTKNVEPLTVVAGVPAKRISGI